MKSWCEVKLKWAVGILHQMLRPLFLSYRIASEFPRPFGENGDRWLVRAQNDVASLAMLASTRRFVLSPTIHRAFCGSNW